MRDIVVHGEEGRERPARHAALRRDDGRARAERRVREGLGGKVYACVCWD